MGANELSSSSEYDDIDNDLHNEHFANEPNYDEMPHFAPMAESNGNEGNADEEPEALIYLSDDEDAESESAQEQEDGEEDEDEEEEDDEEDDEDEDDEQLFGASHHRPHPYNEYHERGEEDEEEEPSSPSESCSYSHSQSDSE